MYKKNIAIILSRFPFPLNKGDKLRAYHQIKYLSNYFDIHLHCLHTEKIEEKEIGNAKINYRMRDAGFSRQRYWGACHVDTWVSRSRHTKANHRRALRQRR